MGDTLRNAGSATTLDYYQERAITTATYPGRGDYQIIYPAIALAEEAGELAGKVLELLRRQAPGEYFVAEAALAVAATCGLVLGLVKKTYRNEPGGQLTQERISTIGHACTQGMRALGNLSEHVHASATVQFPPVFVSIADEVRDGLVSEAGDALWYVACFCTEARIALGYVGDVNYAKLDDRARRGVIKSTGDDR